MKLAACLMLVLAAPLLAEVKEETVTHAGVSFRVVRLQPKQVEVVWKDDKGEPYRTFDKVQAAYARQGRTVKFLMNAGIFEQGGIPSGLHVEGGKTGHPLNTADGEGNFFLKPNGVFAITPETGPDAAGVVHKDPPGTPMRAFVADTAILANGTRQSPFMRLAIQSGPLLLHDGKRHPAFKEGSPNKKLRNGVGIDPEGRVVFAITAKGEGVNFWDFAGLFLQLGCKDALFLDGDISKMVVNPDKPVESNPFAAMFVVAE